MKPPSAACRPLLVALLALAPQAPVLAVDGDADTTFGGDGLVTWNDGGSVSVADVAIKNGAAYAVGRIGLAGEAPALHWKGYNRGGGALDQGCAQASDTLVTLATETRGLAGLIDSSGNLLVAGWAAFLGTETTRRALVTRFDLSGPGCTLDDSFSGNGWTIFTATTWCDTEDCDVVDLVEIRPETGAVLAPRIVALVRSEVLTPPSSRFFLLGLTSSGAIDTGFGGDGWIEVTRPNLGLLASTAKLAIDGNGGLHVLVTRFDPNGIDDLDLFVFSCFPDGGLPMIPLLVIADPGDDDPEDPVGRDIEIAPNGMWIVSYALASTAMIHLHRPSPVENKTLSLDNTIAHEVVVQGNLRLVSGYDSTVVDGLFSSRLLIADLTIVPTDETYGNSGVRFYDVDLGGSNSESVAQLVLWSGRPLIAGTAADASGTSGFLLRAKNAFVFADGFEQGTVAHWSSAIGVDFPD